MIVMHTSLGDIHIELDTENTPKTAASFAQYVAEGFYDGTIFHRVIDGFMIQGGGMTADMRSKATHDCIQNEAKHGALNQRGTVAMARTSDPHSASSQFFINVADNHFLNFKSEDMQGWGYCVFGKVTHGMDVVDKIKSRATAQHGQNSDVPVELIVIEKVVMTETAESA